MSEKTQHIHASTPLPSAAIWVAHVFLRCPTTHPPDAVYSAVLSTSFLYSAPKAEVTVSVSDFLKANLPRPLPPLIAESPAASTGWLRPLLSLFQMISYYFTEPSFEFLFTFPSIVHLCLCSETCGSAGSVNFSPIFLKPKKKMKLI